MSGLVERAARAARPSLWRAFDAAPDSQWTREKRHQELVFTRRVLLALLAEVRRPAYDGPDTNLSGRTPLRTFLIAATLALLPSLAFASSTTSTVDSIRYGVNAKRVSVKLSSPHTGPCANTDYYTFTGKELWANAFLEALENGLTVAVTGTGTCTLGVEEIAFFDVENGGVSARKK